MNPFTLSWLAWLVLWAGTAAWSKRSARQESAASWLVHMVPLMLAFFLLWAHRMPDGILEGAILPYRPWFYGVGLALTLGGLLFTVWARVCLGRNWSGSVQVKAGHELVQNGPYRFVRHPIYTGLLTAILGSALALDQWRGLVAVLIVLAGFVYKLRLEERWMTETFGEAYAEYRRHTRALIPFLF